MTFDNRPIPSGQVLARGVAWIGAFRWTAQVLSWAATLVVIRLLAPADYGIAGLATAFIGVAAILSELGLGTAVVALPTVSREQAGQLNMAALLAGTGFAILTSLAAPFAAGFFAEPALRLVLPVLSLSFILEGIRTVPVALLARRMAYRTTAMLDFARAVVTTLAVLGMAILGLGYWALILGSLAGSAIVGLWVLARHRVPLSWPRLSDLSQPFTYSSHIVVGRALWQVYRTADRMIVGRLLGTVPLGFYTVAWTVASLPGEKLGNVITAATSPFFSAVQGDRARLRHFFLRVTGMLAVVIYPALFGFFIVADLAVPLVLGERWVPAIPLIRALVAYAALQGVATILSQILNVTGHTRTNMWSGAVAVAVLLPAFAVGALVAGTLGVAMAWLITFPLVVWLPLRTVLRVLEVRMAEYLGALQPAVEGALAIVLTVGVLRLGLGGRVGAAAELSVAVLAGVAAFGLLLWLRHPHLIQLARSLRSNSATAAVTGGE
jgi:PST family polysaccharide transporter